MLTNFRSLLMAVFLFVTAGLQAETAALKQTGPAVQVEPAVLKDSADASLAWLNIIDQEKYDEAWEKGALTLKLRLPVKSWTSILDASRKPLGKVVNRKVVDQRTSKNPPGLPAGDYMVMIYSTDFTAKKGATELATLVLESDGKWRGLTYQVHD